MSIHINAKKGDFAKVVLMPGDPLRAKWIAETFLTKVKAVSSVRGMVGYTGYTKGGKKISVMPSGMGQPSIGIYSHELFVEYGVELIIRVGTCGGFHKDLNVKDIVIASGASSDFDYLADFNLHGIYSATPNFDVLETAVSEARKSKAKFMVGNVLSEGIFYHLNKDAKEPWWKAWAKVGALGCEMESYVLYCNANVLGKKALGMFTVSDHFSKPKIMSSEERQKGLVNMIKIAIKVAEKYA